MIQTIYDIVKAHGGAGSFRDESGTKEGEGSAFIVQLTTNSITE